MKKLPLSVASILLMLAIAVDFTSKFMSIAADGILIGAAAFFLYTAIKNK